MSDTLDIAGFNIDCFVTINKRNAPKNSTNFCKSLVNYREDISKIYFLAKSAKESILFCRQDLVGEALVRLGYSSDLIPSARGSIVIRNWKPLPMEKVADGPLLTVGDILAELTSVATLKIQVYRSRPPPPSPAAEVRNKLLRLLLLHSHTLLVSAGCPLDEVWRFRSLTSEFTGF